MKDSPDIEWLRRKWNLPEGAVDAVASLLLAENDGSTACVMAADLPNCGSAISESEGNPISPLVTVRHEGRNYLQSRRLYDAEKDIALQLLARCGESSARADNARLEDLFPGAGTGDLQRKAAQVALSRQLAVVTGGPGTGKTYTLARILALLSEGGIPANHIRLAAPTGKAADRMKKAILESVLGLPESFREVRESLVATAGSSMTIHALIGYNPGLGRAKFGPRNPLPCSVLILDECSMIDALQWRVLLAAIPPDCRLILLGDPNQLESVGQGNVFSELARMANSVASLLHPCHVHLTEARRFKERSGILAMAQALERSDADAAEEILKSSRVEGTARGIAWIEMEEGVPTFDQFPTAIVDALEAVANAPSPAAALEALGNVCVLTAQREFFVGAKVMSAMIDATLIARKSVKNHPIIINRNDPETGLRNGTVGVIHAGADGKRKAYFPGLGGALQEFAVARLPDFTPAWAITIHRSQGSEYENVLVILPHEDSPLATRELLYTAITRARRNVYVIGSLSSVRKAVLTPSSRTTLLAYHLGRA